MITKTGTNESLESLKDQNPLSPGFVLSLNGLGKIDREGNQYTQNKIQNIFF